MVWDRRPRRNERQGDSHDLPIDPPRESVSTQDRRASDRGGFTGPPIALDRPDRCSTGPFVGRRLAAGAGPPQPPPAGPFVGRLLFRWAALAAGLPLPSPNCLHPHRNAGIVARSPASLDCQHRPILSLAGMPASSPTVAGPDRRPSARSSSDRLSVMSWPGRARLPCRLLHDSWTRFPSQP